MKITWLLVIVLAGCCSHRDPNPLQESYRRFLNGPGESWLSYSRQDERLDPAEVAERQTRLEIARSVIDAYEDD